MCAPQLLTRRLKGARGPPPPDLPPRPSTARGVSRILSVRTGVETQSNAPRVRCCRPQAWRRRWPESFERGALCAGAVRVARGLRVRRFVEAQPLPDLREVTLDDLHRDPPARPRPAWIGGSSPGMVESKLSAVNRVSTRAPTEITHLRPVVGCLVGERPSRPHQMPVGDKRRLARPAR